jgi:hypothetical protein
MMYPSNPLYLLVQQQWQNVQWIGQWSSTWGFPYTFGNVFFTSNSDRYGKQSRLDFAYFLPFFKQDLRYFHLLWPQLV